jgi:glycerol-3-phosphate dehydrogenase (NAD(P)+)
MRVGVLGGGAWGTALAIAAAGRHDVRLWARDAGQAQQMREQRCNARYLPEVPLPEALFVESSLHAVIGHARHGLLLLATPMAALRDLLHQLPVAQPAVWVCKGFEQGSGALGHEIARAERPGVPCAVLSGPSFALEVARGQPTALVAASEDAALAQAAVDVFHGDALRVYTSQDVVGVEVGGAVKNVIALAAGIVDGLAAAGGMPGGPPPPGLNARAALITRGLAEMTRLGSPLGARGETFMGLSGLGDLVLTATGDLSRNRRVGLRLAQGQTLAQVLRELGHVAEGVYSAPTVLARAQALAVEMPITQAVVDVLQGRTTPVQAMAALMGREPRAEH